MKFFNKSVKKSEKGQVLVFLALTFIGLVAIIGLAIDTGYMYVSYARLRRGVDAAALAATGEFKRGYNPAALLGAAQQMLNMNGIADVTNPPVVAIDTCDSLPGDPALCTVPLKKIVRVTVTEDVPTFFLAVIGFRTVPITVSSFSQAASVDVVLTLDASESMTLGSLAAPITGVMSDPKICNESDPGAIDGYPGDCHPFQEVKKAAKEFADQLYYPYDRVAVVSFSQRAKMELALSDNLTTIQTTIKNLTVTEGIGRCVFSRDLVPGDRALYSAPPNVADPGKTPYYPNDPGGPCRFFESEVGPFDQMWCPMKYGTDPDPSRCGTTNIGNGIALAGSILAGVYPSYLPVPPGGWPEKRDDALWVLILLSDGAANAAYNELDQPICPHYTWGYDYGPQCRDHDSRVRHPNSSPLYDADDNARDMFDMVDSNGALIFTVGLGNLTTKLYANDLGPPAGETLLKYPSEPPPGLNNGDYYYADDGGSNLSDIFLKIANKIATRLTQ
jgi:Flp pilus assembly protein TadG